MTTDRLPNVCLVGCGGIGARHARAALAAADAVRYGAVFDTDPARATALLERTGLTARTLPTWEAVLRDPEIDGVDLCLPNSLHARFDRSMASSLELKLPEGLEMESEARGKAKEADAVRG